MKRNIMLTVLSICVILILVGCKNGYNSIKEDKRNEDADKFLLQGEALIENTSSRRNCGKFGRNF